jgi:hypothetical protein
MTRSREAKTMGKSTAITCVFLDIGGVLLTDGWDHHARKRAATTFELEWAEMEERHSLNFDTYEEGKLTIEEALPTRDYETRLHRHYDRQGYWVDEPAATKDSCNDCP